ncbi:MAG TPA: hypothetical protein VHC47_07755 [Mucilaginibacter sp.]|nr:hypothetical protein [Mucilaginibacter sp.]
MKKILLGAAALFLIIMSGAWYYVFQYSKTHHRDVANENALWVSAAQIVKDYQANEQAANAKYLNKAIGIQGVVLKRGKDQAGDITLTLKSGDPFVSVFCTLKPGISPNLRDSTVVVKGICTGFLSDVVLDEAIVVNK